MRIPHLSACLRRRQKVNPSRWNAASLQRIVGVDDSKSIRLARTKACESRIVEDRRNPIDLAQTSACEPVLQFRLKRALLYRIQLFQKRFQFAHLLAAKFDSCHGAPPFARISNRKCNLALEAVSPQLEFWPVSQTWILTGGFVIFRRCPVGEQEELAKPREAGDDAQTNNSRPRLRRFLVDAR